MISMIAGILTFGLYAVPEVFGESPEKWNQSWNMGMTMDLPQELKVPSGDVFQWDILVEPPQEINMEPFMEFCMTHVDIWRRHSL